MSNMNTIKKKNIPSRQPSKKFWFPVTVITRLGWAVDVSYVLYMREAPVRTNYNVYVFRSHDSS